MSAGGAPKAPAVSGNGATGADVECPTYASAPGSGDSAAAAGSNHSNCAWPRQPPTRDAEPFSVTSASADSPRKKVVGGDVSARSTVAKHGAVMNVRASRPLDSTSTPADGEVSVERAGGEEVTSQSAA